MLKFDLNIFKLEDDNKIIEALENSLNSFQELQNLNNCTKVDFLYELSKLTEKLYSSQKSLLENKPLYSKLQNITIVFMKKCPDFCEDISLHDQGSFVDKIFTIIKNNSPYNIIAGHVSDSLIKMLNKVKKESIVAKKCVEQISEIIESASLGKQYTILNSETLEYFLRNYKEEFFDFLLNQKKDTQNLLFEYLGTVNKGLNFSG